MPLVIQKSARGVATRLRLLAKRCDDPSPVWPKVGSYMSATMRKQFASEGAYLGTPWQPLKPRYRLWKLSHGYSRKILVQSGHMRQTFVGRPMDIEEYHGKSARFGSNDQKAIWHHNGTHRHGKRVNPPRKIMQTTPFMEKDISNIIRNYIVGGKSGKGK